MLGHFSSKETVWFYLDTLHFWYDAAGMPTMVTYNGTNYYYQHNLQGDIIGLMDMTGNTVVSYNYDSWGKQISCTGSLASTLGIVNPLRYRGYIFDEETGMYYLQSRYYNPEWGRFVNGDTLIGDIGFLSTHNLFTYCLNNPINTSDPTGKKPLMPDDWEENTKGTGHVGIQAQFNAGPIISGVSIQYNIVWDNNGNIGAQTTVGYRLVGLGCASAIVHGGGTSAKSIYDLEGWGLTLGGSGAYRLVTVGGEGLVSFASGDTPYTPAYIGGEGGIGIGYAPNQGLEFHQDATYTWTNWSFKSTGHFFWDAFSVYAYQNLPAYAPDIKKAVDIYLGEQ